MLQEINLKSRVIKNILLHPIVSFPLTIGFIFLILSFDGPRTFRILSLAFLTFAVVNVMLRATVLFQTIVRNTFTQIHEEKRKFETTALDLLDLELSTDDEPRNEAVLRQLRDTYEAFAETVKSGIVREYDFLNTSRKLFVSCVANLRESYLKRVSAVHLPPKSRKTMLAQSEQLLKEVEAGVDSLAQALVEIHNLNGPQQGELSAVRKELEERLEFAKKVEKEVQNLDWLETAKYLK